MKKTGHLLLISFLLINVCFNALTLPSNGGDVKTSEKVITYINGDWDVTKVENRINETIILTGNLTIYSGGNLTFHNVTLKMNCSFNGEYHIEVLSGGEFYIYDNDWDNTTTGDVSNITSNTAYHYLFYVRDSGEMIMKNSELHECGWDSDSKGLCIYSDNVLVDHSLISYNYYGIYADGSSATITNNTITKNGIYGLWFKNSNLTIVNNTISSNPGVSSGVGDAIQFSEASPLIVNNTILDFHEGIVYLGYLKDKPKIIDNVIKDGKQRGITCDGGRPIIRRNTIENIYGEGHGEGIGIWLDFGANAIINDTTISVCTQEGVGSDTAFGTITNSTIHSNPDKDFSLSDSQFTTLNTTFNSSKLSIASSSRLTVQNYLHVKVVDNHSYPVQNADVKVIDINETGYEQTVYCSPGFGGSDPRTDSEGMARWIPVTDRIYKGSNIATENTTRVEVKYNGFTFTENPRDVNMSNSHTEIFSAEQLAQPTTLTLTATPSVLTADGVSTSLITATVTNETGDPIGGVTVNFVIESGCGSLSSDSNITDANGIATTTYTAGTTTGGDVVIKATANGVSNTTTITLVAGEPAHVSISASPNTIIADGLSNSTLSVTVTDLYGNSVSNKIVYFVNETGIGSISPTSNTTNINGVASTVYTAGNYPGVEIINATCDGIWNTTTITLAFGVPANISLTANPTGLVADGISTSVITAVITDDYGNPVPNVEILFSFDANPGGGNMFPLKNITDQNGITKTAYTSGTIVGDVVINATNTTYNIYNTTIIFLTSGLPAKIEISSTPDSLFANSGQESVIVATITDVYDNPIGGINVNFSLNTNLGGIINPKSNITNENGIVTATYTSGTTLGIEIVNVTVQNIWNITTISLISDIPANIHLTVFPDLLVANGSSTAKITATVTDQYNNPVSDVKIDFLSIQGLGTINPKLNLTDSDGVAMAIYTAGTQTGLDTINVTNTTHNIWNNTYLSLVSDLPEEILISLSEDRLVAKSNENSTITIFLRDENGNPVKDAIIHFSIGTSLGGSLSTNTSVTDESGRAVTVYTAGTILGDEIINVTCDYIWNTTTIHLVPGSIAEIFISPSDPLDLYIGDTQQFTAMGHDQHGNLNTSWVAFWHVDENIGMINETGFFTATKKGSGAVNCTDNATGVYNIAFVNVLNSAPIIETIENQTAYEGERFILQVHASDPDNDTITFSDNSTLFNINSTTGLISFTPSYDSAGDYLINITITDGEDFAWQTFKLIIINVNRPPTATISSPLDNAEFTTKDNILFDATSSFDPDNDNLTYSWESSIDGSIGNTASFSKKLSKGTHIITITVDDGNGGMDTKQIAVIVNKPSEPSDGFIPGFETVSLLVLVCLLAVIIILLHKRKT